ncbi:hypothetical protein, partial [Burkholderia stagnalis]
AAVTRFAAALNTVAGGNAKAEDFSPVDPRTRDCTVTLTTTLSDTIQKTLNDLIDKKWPARPATDMSPFGRAVFEALATARLSGYTEPVEIQRMVDEALAPHDLPPPYDISAQIQNGTLPRDQLWKVFANAFTAETRRLAGKAQWEEVRSLAIGVGHKRCNNGAETVPLYKGRVTRFSSGGKELVGGVMSEQVFTVERGSLPVPAGDPRGANFDQTDIVWRPAATGAAVVTMFDSSDHSLDVRTTVVPGSTDVIATVRITTVDDCIKQVFGPNPVPYALACYTRDGEGGMNVSRLKPWDSLVLSLPW